MEIKSHNTNIPDLQESRRSLIRWVVLAAAGLSILGGISWFRTTLRETIHARLSEAAKRGEPTNSTQLNQWRRHVPPEENGAFKILEAAAALSNERPKVADLKQIEKKSSFPLDPTIKSTFQLVSSNNSEALTLLDRAAELTNSDFLIDWTPGPGTLLPHLSKLKTLALLARTRLTLALNEANADVAVQSVIATLRLAHSVAGEPCMVSQLVKIYCVNAAAGELELLLSLYPLGHEQLDSLRQGFHEAESENQKGMTRALLGERCLGIGIFETPIRTGLSFASDLPKSVCAIYPFLEFTGIHDRDFLLYLKILDAGIKASELPFPDCLTATDRLASKVENELSHRRLMIFSKLLLPSIRNPMQKMANLEGHLRRAEVGLAIEEYRLRHEGHFPESMSQLVPEFAQTLPIDPFTGNPLRYERFPNGFAIIGSGSDSKGDPDTSGRSDGAQKLHDVSFRVQR